MSLQEQTVMLASPKRARVHARMSHACRVNVRTCENVEASIYLITTNRRATLAVSERTLAT
jgi:hypothetical protein